MTTREVADYLRLKERKVYDLARNGGIPCVRFTGKLLFPRQTIDLWVMNHLEGDRVSANPVPPVYAGSQDPLLEWALREAHADLGLLCHGSGDGVQRLLDGKAQLAGLHVLNPVSGGYNEPMELGLGGMRDLLLIEWAQRMQGLVVAPGNPLAITTMDDLRRPGLRIARRQRGAGAAILFRYLLDEIDLATQSLTVSEHPALTEDDLALQVRDGTADCGLAVEASAWRHGLTFVPLIRERFDLAMRRRSYFEEPVQRLIAFSHGETFCERAATLGGYDISHCGEVRYNA